MPIDYDKQRPGVEAPVVTLRGVRASHGLTLDDVCGRISAITNKPFSKGALSAIENGHRGASQETLAALETALRLPPGSIAVPYEPSHDRRKVAV